MKSLTYRELGTELSVTVIGPLTLTWAEALTDVLATEVAVIVTLAASIGAV
jgi:hypothetical protein